MRPCGEHVVYDENCPWCWTANLPRPLTQIRAGLGYILRAYGRSR